MTEVVRCAPSRRVLVVVRAKLVMVEVSFGLIVDFRLLTLVQVLLLKNWIWVFRAVMRLGDEFLREQSLSM